MDQNPFQSLVDALKGFIHGNDIHAILIALAILIITFVVARLATLGLRRILRSDNSPLPSSSILVNIARVCIWLIGISIILAGCFNVNVNGMIAALGVGGIAVSLGLQDTIQNFFGGLAITLMKIIKPGDHIVVGSTEGIVEDVNWRQTAVRDLEGSMHIIPNSALNSEEVTKMNPTGLAIVPFIFANNGQDLDAQVEAMEKEAKEAIGRKHSLRRDPWIYLTSVGSATVNANLHFVIRDKKSIRAATDAAMRAIAAVSSGPLSQPDPSPSKDR